MPRVNWKLVALFYGMALGWVSLVAIGLVVTGMGDMTLKAAQFAQLAVGFLYMPAPLVAALIVERIAGRGYLIRYTFQGFGRKLLRLVGTGVIAMGGLFLLNVVLMYLLGNVLHVPGVGSIASTSTEVVRNLAEAIGPRVYALAATSPLPPPVALIGIGLVSGIVAGFTINGVFAFGEEYGWRGWLMNELRPLGPVKANVLTGVMWGLWHTPLILLGFNYGPHHVIGPLLMVAFCTPLSFLFWRARDYTGSLLEPAIMHGAFNGAAGFFVLLVIGRNPVFGVPVGILGAVSIAIVAAVLWAVSAGRLRDTVDRSTAPAELAERSNPEAQAVGSEAMA